MAEQKNIGISGYLEVYPGARGRWIGYVTVGGRQITVSSGGSPEEAMRGRDNYIRWMGLKAPLNCPEQDFRGSDRPKVARRKRGNPESWQLKW